MRVQQAINLLMNGNHSVIPDNLTHSPYAADLAMVRALEMTWEANPYNRSSARQVVHYLRGELEKLSSYVDEPFYQVSVPKLPLDFVYDETDWYENYRKDR